MDASEQIKQALIPKRLEDAAEKEWNNFLKGLLLECIQERAKLSVVTKSGYVRNVTT